MSGLLFVTAPGGDHKTINLALLYLRDWHYGCGDRFTIVISKSPDALLQQCEEESSSVTEPPVPTDMVNEWDGASIPEVEAFCLKLGMNSGSVRSVNPNIFVVFDGKSHAEKTMVLGERTLEIDDSDDMTRLGKFNKFRTPWHQTYSTWANLDIANVSFEEYADAEAGPDKDRWWDHNDFETEGSTVFMDKDSRAKRDAEIERLKQEGRI